MCNITGMNVLRKCILNAGIIVVFIVQILSAQPDNRLFWDGSDWRRISSLADHAVEVEYRIKAAYVNGLLDGRLFYYLKSWPGHERFADSLYAEPMDYLSTSELVRVLDELYRDPLNSYIPVPSAVIIANMIGEQASQETINNYIRDSKEWINSLMLQIREEGNSKLLDDKLKDYRERKQRY